MNIVRWDPFRDFGFATANAWMPPVDIYQNGEHELVLTAELPDLSRDDIDITVENFVLTLKGEKKLSSEVKQEHLHHVERRYGSFSRSFSLPQTVDAAKMSADYKNGVLTVRVPLREEAKPRQIKVNVARIVIDAVDREGAKPLKKGTGADAREQGRLSRRQPRVLRFGAIMDEANELIPQDSDSRIPSTPAPPITSRFLFVDVAALRAKQLRRGARVRFRDGDGPSAARKAERVAMEEVRRGLVSYDVPAANAQRAGKTGAESES